MTFAYTLGRAMALWAATGSGGVPDVPPRRSPPDFRPSAIGGFGRQGTAPDKGEPDPSDAVACAKYAKAQAKRQRKYGPKVLDTEAGEG